MPASDSDAISFGELSSDYDSADSASHPRKPPSTARHAANEPTLDTDGFEFSASATPQPNMEQDGFAFADLDPTFFPDAAYPTAEQGSVHTMHDENEQPSAEHTPFAQSAHSVPRNSRQRTEKAALGVLYCGTCDRYFGNEKVFKRHFMFGIRHGEEPRDMRDLYYKVWGQTWADEAREMERVGRVAEVDAMEL
ncbi:hypothetical protein EKO04_004632 [Ascochyta lentis]|uniref:C2H2-type domain-containing protein n=1 Tax=Ascochyta lentis TaxID=205686 RepID=A0A8H7J7Z0_9PLEO|nr:hypothetical protein EKO04_004632 [Ascochyta lentis]